MGNPGAFSYSHPLWTKGFLDALGSPHYYTASTQDVSNRFAASQFLYGSPFLLPIPDLARTDFLLMVGANPLVSPRQRADRAAGQGPAARDHRARRPRRRRRPAPLGDRGRVRAPRDPPRLRRLAAALAAAGDLRRGPRGRARRSSASRAAVDGLRRARRRAPAEATEPPHRRRRRRGARARPRPRRRRARRRLRAHRLLPGAQRHRSSPSCSTRSTSSPATSTARAARCSATRRSTSRASPTSRPRHLRQGALAGRRPARGARRAARLADGEGDHDPRPGPDPGAVRLRRQPGALGAERPRARGGDGEARPLRRDRPLRLRHRAATPTTCCRRRRCTSARTSRCRS